METSRWQRMLGLVIVLSMALLLIALLVGWNQISSLAGESMGPDGSQAAMAFIVVILLLVAAVAVIMAGLLIRGATRMKTALRTKEQALFNNGLNDLKIFFIIYGVISILGLLGTLGSFLF
jgi:hypothetical protein